MVPEYFDSSIVKINKDGDQVLSTTLDEGEKLVTGETYEEVRDGALLTKSHDVPLTPLAPADAPVSTMTLDATRTSTFGGSTASKDGDAGYSNSGEDTSYSDLDDKTTSGVKVDGAEEEAQRAKEDDVTDERQPAPTNSGAPATEDAPSEDGQPNSNEAPAEADDERADEDAPERPSDSESKEKWYAYAEALSAHRGEEFKYADDYEGVTKKTLVEEFGA